MNRHERRFTSGFLDAMAAPVKRVYLHSLADNVRCDILYVGDVVDTFLAVWRNIDTATGCTYNFGGGRLRQSTFAI